MNNRARWIYGACVLGSLTLIVCGLRLEGAAEIRANSDEVVFLAVGGAVWLLIATTCFSWVGLSLRDDAVERKNAAALIALCGAIVAAALIYVGASVGEGPSYTNNLFSGALAAGGFFALWIVLELIGRVSISVAEERDSASGVRLCGFFLAAGLVLGRAVAGDWHSESATLHDLIHDGWPAAAICALAATLEIFLRPNRRFATRPWVTFGLVPALAYIAITLLWIWHLGAWEGMLK